MLLYEVGNKDVAKGTLYREVLGKWINLVRMTTGQL